MVLGNVPYLLQVYYTGVWRNGIQDCKIGSSQEPSLVYRLGGHSNSCAISSDERFNPILQRADYDDDTIKR